MATLATETWTGTTGAGWPAQWSLTGGTATIQANRGRQTTAATAGFQASVLTLSGMTAVTDTDATVTVYPSTTSFYWAMLRICGTGTGGSAWTPSSGYQLWLVPGAGNVVNAELKRYSGGTETSIVAAADTTVPWSASAGATLRLQRVGSVIRFKVWAAGGSEPGTWTGSYTDGSPIATAGKVALVTVNNNDSIAKSNDWDDLTVNDVSVVVAGVATVGEIASAQSVTCNVPTGVVAGELLVATVAHADATNAVPDQAGWTTVAKANPTVTESALFYRVATGSEPASYTFTGLNASGVSRATAEMVRLSGVDTTTPLDVAAVTATATGTSITTPTVTTVTAGALMIYSVSRQLASTGDINVATGTTLLANTTGTGRRNILAFESRPTAGATGTRLWTATDATSLNMGGIAAAFRPASAATPSGTVALTGTGTLVVTGFGDTGTVALTGSGTLVVTGSGAGGPGSGTVALTGSGTLSIGGSGTGAVVARALGWSAFARGAAYALSSALPIIECTTVLRHMGLSKANLTTPFTVANWTAVQPSYGIALFRSGRQVFAGPVVSRTLTWDAATNAATIKVEAVGDEVVLADRLAMPDPLRAADDQTVNDYWTATGPASTAMRQLISDQAGATCAASRKVTGLTLGVDPNVGTSRTWTALFDNVLGLLATMSAASGADLGLRMTSSAGALTATIVAPRNRVGTVTFSADLSNLGSTTFTETAPTVANALVAGQGDLHLRTRKTVASADSGTTRWARQAWSYKDRRDTNDVPTLTVAANDELLRGQAGVALSLTLLDSAAATYGIDWDLGDKVTVYVGLRGQTKVAQVDDVVRELTFAVDSSGTERLSAAIGSVSARTFLPTPAQRALTAVDQRVTDLTKNK